MSTGHRSAANPGRESILLPPSGLDGVHVLRVRSCLKPYSMHHSTFVFTSVLGGRGRWRYRRWSRDVCHGQVMLIEPGETHVTTEVATPASFDALFVDPVLVDGVLRRHGLRPDLHFGVPDIAVPAAFERLRVLHETFDRRDVSPDVRQGALEEAIVILAERTGSGRPLSKVGSRDALVEAAREEIQSRLAAKWSSDGSGGARTLCVTEMAERRGMGLVAFIRAFRAAYGTTPYHYAQILKIGRALHLIRRGPRGATTSITAVAAEAGFYDACQFSRIFRRHLGLSPRDFAVAAHRGWRR